MKANDIDTQKIEVDETMTSKDDAISNFSGDEVVVDDTMIRETLSPAPPVFDSPTKPTDELPAGAHSPADPRVSSVWSGLEWSVYCFVLLWLANSFVSTVSPTLQFV